MPKADSDHYKLLTSALNHYIFSVDADPALKDQIKAATRNTIQAVHKAAMAADDPDLLALCYSAERIVESD